MASSINPIAGASATANSNSTTATSKSVPTEQTFLQLLVAQLQNQDPLNPTDGTQFLSQLTQISSLEQLLEIRQDMDKLSGGTTPSGGSGGGTGSGS